MSSTASQDQAQGQLADVDELAEIVACIGGGVRVPEIVYHPVAEAGWQSPPR